MSHPYKEDGKDFTGRTDPYCKFYSRLTFKHHAVDKPYVKEDFLDGATVESILDHKIATLYPRRVVGMDKSELYDRGLTPRRVGKTA